MVPPPEASASVKVFNLWTGNFKAVTNDSEIVNN